mmetsp:Transcript_13899/g.30300  ORF Transcript_13899/g.30300 Transcript_13899/m.30300 type:complete len:203 (+) Transcript_13899:71-679(+)
MIECISFVCHDHSKRSPLTAQSFHSEADSPSSSLLAKNSRPVIKASAANAPIPPFFPARVIALIITPAETTPVKIEDTAKAVGIPNRNAPIAPVQAPVPGRGMPTNAARDAHCFSTDPTPRLADFFSARERMGDISFFNLSFLSKNNKGIIGAIFPRTQTGRIFVMGNPIQTPTGTAPRSSTTGMAEMMARIAKSGMPKDRK